MYAHRHEAAVDVRDMLLLNSQRSEDVYISISIYLYIYLAI